MRSHAGAWRSQFTRDELRLIERAMEPELEWAARAYKYDLPGPKKIRRDVLMRGARLAQGDRKILRHAIG